VVIYDFFPATLVLWVVDVLYAVGANLSDNPCGFRCRDHNESFEQIILSEAPVERFKEFARAVENNVVK